MYADLHARMMLMSIGLQSGPVLQEKAGCAAVTVCGGSGLTACEMLQKSKRMSIFDVCNDEIPGIDYAL